MGYEVCDITDIEVDENGLCNVTYSIEKGKLGVIHGVDPAPFGGFHCMDRVLKVGEEFFPVPVRKRRICGVAMEPGMSGQIRIVLEDGTSAFGGVFAQGSGRAALGIMGWDLIEEVSGQERDEMHKMRQDRPENAVIGIFASDFDMETGRIHAFFANGMVVAAFAEHDATQPARYRMGFDFLDPKVGIQRVYMYTDRVVAMPSEFVRMLLISGREGGYECLAVLRGLLTVLQEAN